MKKHYLFLMRSLWIGGAERFQVALLSYLNYEKYSVTCAVKRDIFSPYFIKQKLPVNVVELPKINAGLESYKNFFKFYRFFKKLKPDVVIFNQFLLSSFFLFEFIAAYLITKGNVYMIVHDSPLPVKKYKSNLHLGFIPGLGISWRLERFGQRFIAHLSKNILAVSQYIKINLINWHDYSETKIKVIEHGVDTDKFIPSEREKIKMRKLLGLPIDSQVIISTARLDKNKRLDRLIKAFDILSKEEANIYLLLVGDGPESLYLKNMVEKLDMLTKSRIYFLGFCDDVVPYLQTSDIFVLPSDSEGFSIARLEAMSCGLITIVTDCAGPVDFIKNGFNGFIVEKNNQGVVYGLRKILSLSPEQKDRIRYNARECIKLDYSLPNKIENVMSILDIKS